MAKGAVRKPCARDPYFLCYLLHFGHFSLCSRCVVTPGAPTFATLASNRSSGPHFSPPDPFPEPYFRFQDLTLATFLGL